MDYKYTKSIPQRNTCSAHFCIPFVDSSPPWHPGLVHRSLVDRLLACAGGGHERR